MFVAQEPLALYFVSLMLCSKDWETNTILVAVPPKDLPCSRKTYSARRRPTVQQEDLQCKKKTYNAAGRLTVYEENLQCSAL